jgi:hypothetical protein
MLKSSGLFLFRNKLCESGVLVFPVDHMDDRRRATPMTLLI